MWRNLGVLFGAYIVFLITHELYSALDCSLLGWLAHRRMIHNGYELYYIDILIGRPITGFVASMFIGLFARNRYIVLALLIACASCAMSFEAHFYLLPPSLSKIVLLPGGLSPYVAFAIESAIVFAYAIAGSILGNRIITHRRNRLSNSLINNPD